MRDLEMRNSSCTTYIKGNVYGSFVNNRIVLDGAGGLNGVLFVTTRFFILDYLMYDGKE